MQVVRSTMGAKGGASRSLSAHIQPASALILACAGFFVLWLVGGCWTALSTGTFTQTIVKPAYWVLVASVNFWWSPVFLLVFPVLLLWSAIAPADPTKRILSRGLLTDFCWALVRTTILVLVISLYAGFLREMTKLYLGPLKFPLQDTPLYLKAIIVFLASDFLYWIRHYISHKVPILWRFHAVHHSQTELNPFTIDRIHPVEYLLTITVTFVPMLVVTDSLGITLGFFALRSSHDAFVHTNIRTNLGWLKYVMVTPQSHRVHHSAHDEHHDLNFGAILSIWDRLFGTHHASYIVYPPTGISDSAFPYEARGVSPFNTIVQQILYPLGVVRKRLDL